MFRTSPFLILMVAACGSGPTGESCPAHDRAPDDFADCVVEFEPDPASSFGHADVPDVVLGPPGGTADVASLGCGGSIVLFFDDPIPVDGPGADLIVFENPFSNEFPEPGEVSVSDDGLTWSSFNCDPATLAGCAGVSPTLATASNGVDPRDPELAGGDAFDLADLGLSEARYLRIDDRSAEYWEPRDMSYCDPGQAGSGGFDLDAVAIVHAKESS
jgi:hypothetical protein